MRFREVVLQFTNLEREIEVHSCINECTSFSQVAPIHYYSNGTNMRMSKARHYVTSIFFHKDTWLCLMISLVLSLLILWLALWHAHYSYNYIVTTRFLFPPFRLYFWSYFLALIISFLTGYLLAQKRLQRFLCAIYLLFDNTLIKSRTKKCIAKLIKYPLAMVYTYHFIPIFFIVTFIHIPLMVIFLAPMRIKYGMPISISVCKWLFLYYILASITMYFIGYLCGHNKKTHIKKTRRS